MAKGQPAKPQESYMRFQTWFPWFRQRSARRRHCPFDPIGSPQPVWLFARVEVQRCGKVGADMSATTSNPLQTTVNWLAANTRFPGSRLQPGAETLLCVAALAAAAEAAETARFLVQRRDGAKDSALRAHAMRRSQVHYKCDNSAKV